VHQLHLLSLLILVLFTKSISVPFLVFVILFLPNISVEKLSSISDSLTPDDIVSQINTQAIANLGYSVAETFNDGGVKLRLFSKDRGSFTYNETIPSTSSTGIGYVEIVSVSHASKTADFQNTTKWTVGDIAYCND